MSKKYLKFLLKERRVVLIFFFILYFGISMTPTLYGSSKAGTLLETLMIAGVLSVILTYVLPVLLLAFVHRRRSADLYLALPVSRKQQLVTILLFSFGVAFSYFLITVLVSVCVNGLFGILPKVLVTIGYAAFMIAVMTLVNTAMYLVANNLFDGIVMIAAYTFMPALIWLTLMIFVEVMVAGASISTFDNFNRISVYTSPMVMLLANFMSVCDRLTTVNSDPVIRAYIILPAVYALFSCILLKIHFIDRRSERADQVSDDPLAYPAAVHICLFLSLITLSASLMESSLRTVLVFWLLLLLVYIVAMFVYKRSLKLEKKPFIIFAAMTALCVGFCRVGWNTKCFGLAESYDLRGSNSREALNYNYSYSFIDDSDIDQITFIDDYDYTTEKTVHFELLVPAGKLDQYQEAVDIAENYRKQLIAGYYAKQIPSGRTHAYLGVNNSHHEGQYEVSHNHYGYSSSVPMSLDDLLRMNKITPVSVEVYDERIYEWKTIPLEEFLERRN